MPFYLFFSSSFFRFEEKRTGKVGVNQKFLLLNNGKLGRISLYARLRHFLNFFQLTLLKSLKADFSIRYFASCYFFQKVQILYNTLLRLFYLLNFSDTSRNKSIKYRVPIPTDNTVLKKI